MYKQISIKEDTANILEPLRERYGSYNEAIRQIARQAGLLPKKRPKTKLERGLEELEIRKALGRYE